MTDESISATPAEARLRTVVVDDDPISRLVLRHLTESLGHDASDASGAAEALALVKLGGFDVVLADLEMPGLSGFDLLAGIQAEHADPARRPLVVAVTGHVGDDLIEQVRDAGFFAHIPKPVSIAVLDQVLHRVIDELAGHRPEFQPEVDDGLPQVLGDISRIWARERRFVGVVMAAHAARGRQLLERGEQALRAGDTRRAVSAIETLSRATAAIGMNDIEAQARTLAARMRSGDSGLQRLSRLSQDFEASIDRGYDIVETLTGTRPGE
jgi:CheY-like chemotaxis protein